MGSVTLELEFKTRKLKLDVCPEAALIIALFKTKGTFFFTNFFFFFAPRKLKPI